MNTPIQYSNEAFEILHGIANDAMLLAQAAESETPEYVEQCLRTVLQFHPDADRVTVTETSMTMTHGSVVVTYNIVVDPNYEAIRRTQEERELRKDEYDLATTTLVEIAEATVEAAGTVHVEDITSFIEQAIRNHKFADRLSVYDTTVVEYKHNGISEQFDLMDLEVG